MAEGRGCWRVEKALQEMNIEYDLVPGPSPRRSSPTRGRSGADPAIEFENGVWYREESREMAKTIRAGKLMERATSPS